MNGDWVKGFQMRSASAATFLPPAMVEETGWDILLALHSDPRRELCLERLTAVASVSEAVALHWLAGLEERHLITGAKDALTGELRAILTLGGRELLDRYLSATSDLQVGAHE
jgi:hypothetical protein